MYGFSRDLQFSGLNGATLSQIRLGVGDVQLVFDSNIILSIQSELAIFKNEQLAATWTPQHYWSSLEFQQVFNKTALRQPPCPRDFCR